MASSSTAVRSSVSYETMVLVHGELSPIEKWHWVNIAIKSHDLGLMKELISAGACVNFPKNVPGSDEVAPLHNCVSYDLLKGIRPLVEAGANVDMQTLLKYRQTPLHLAIVEGSLAMVKELISLGADPLCLVRTGQVPPSNLLSSYDCFELVERCRCTHSSSELVDYFRQYRLFEEDKLKLSHLYWGQEQDVPEKMPNPTAVCVKDKIFVCESWYLFTPHLCVFSVVSRKWSKLRFYGSREVEGTTLATTNNQVHCLGGGWSKDEKKLLEWYSKLVYTLDCGSLQWSDNTLPPLNVGRVWATSTSFEDVIVVAGGVGEGGRYLSSVEVLNSSQQSSTWWKVCDLPVGSSVMQCTVSDTDIFVGCGVDTEHTIYSCRLSAVEGEMVTSSSKYSELFWHALPETPLRWSGLAVVNNCLVSVGGHDDYDVNSSGVHLYNGYKKKWTKVSDLTMSRDSPAVVFCKFENKHDLFVFGGYGAYTSVESCEVL